MLISRNVNLQKDQLFLSSLADSNIPQDDIDDFMKDLNSLTQENGYDTVVGMIDRLDNENKSLILSNLVRNCAEKQYGVNDFLRVANALERVPYSDLRNLPRYINDYYFPGESELLAASGLVIMTITDAGTYDNTTDNDSGSKYGVSAIGETMLRFGLETQNYKYKGQGTTINNI